MLPPGHPYLTAELAGQRAEQRRILRSFPDWIVINACPPRPGPRLSDPDDVLVERELRRIADRELEPLRCWLDAWRLHTEKEMLARWFAKAEVGAVLEDVAKDVQGARETWRAAEYPPGLFSSILRVIALLAWADDQAGEYQDPRLAHHHAAWRGAAAPPPRSAPPLHSRATPGTRESRHSDTQFWRRSDRR
jgi:hypothetical protein